MYQEAIRCLEKWDRNATDRQVKKRQAITRYSLPLYEW